jgi:Zn-dependent protease with chaperone function
MHHALVTGMARQHPNTRRVAPIVLAALIASAALGAQTPVSAPKNKYTPAQDVELGRQAAQQVEQELPLLRDNRVHDYAEEIGRRLVAEIPAEFQHPEFRYSFDVVNVREINAFALPGGPMFVNRGMLEAAKTEGEVAGVMAHELSHVALRHGTAQATKATPYAIGQMAGAVIGAIVGGRTGAVISQGSQFGIGTAFLRFGREYEKQADILGAQIMARAGYDPRDMANMFKTIEKSSGGSGPQWMSDHPNPGNRAEYITKEAQSLRVANATRDTREFQDVQARLRGMSPAPTTEQVTRNAQNRNPRPSDGGNRPVGTVGGNVPAPASRYTTYTEGNVFRVSVPSNWRELPGENVVTFAPEGAYGSSGNQSVFTHGVEIGIARNESHDLQTATDELIDSLRSANPRLGRSSGYQRTNVGGRSGLYTAASNVSDVTRREERIEVYTTVLSDGNLFYMIGVAPIDDYGMYQNTFRRVASSIQLAR